MISKDINGKTYVTNASQLSWRPSAYGIVMHSGKILLVEQHGKYHLPGGGVELGENPSVAVLREIKEETGCTATNPQLIDINSSLFTTGADEEPINIVHHHALLIYYLCQYVSINDRDINLDAYESKHKLKAEWVNLSLLNKIKVGTTVDWRGIVARTLK